MKLTPARLAAVALLGMAMAWGTTFFMLKDLLTRLPAADLLAVRFAISLVALVVVARSALRMSRRTFVQGLVLGVLFTSAQLVQTVALGHTPASVSGFLTGLYVVFTPLLEAVIFRRRLSPTVWAAVVFATFGMAVLTIAPGALSGGFGVGEVMTVLCALLFGAHIVATGRFATPSNALSLSVVQTGVVALGCLAFALPGGIVLPASVGDWAAIGYLAVICGALVIWLQMWAQARIEPTRAAVIMSTEPVWAAVFAVLLGGEAMRFNTVAGGALMMIGIYLAIVAPVRRLIRR